MKRFIKALVVGTAMAGALVGTSQPSKAQDAIQIIAVTHGQASDPFWSIVKNGMTQAAEDMNVSVDYRAPVSYTHLTLPTILLV